jgi:hypothetical protein
LQPNFLEKIMRKRLPKFFLKNADRKLRLNAASTQISIKVLTPDRKGGRTWTGNG